MHFCRSALIFTLLAPLAVAADTQKDAEGSLARGIDAMDIRSAGSKPFRLEYRFRFNRSNTGESAEGGYQETWISSDHWRREISFSDFHQTEVGGKDKRWILRDLSTEPPEVRYLREIVQIRNIEIGKVKNRSGAQNGSWARCFTSHLERSEQTLCFDPANGLLSQRKWTWRSGKVSCDYADYQKFGDKMYPHKLSCTDEFGLNVDGIVTELGEEDSVGDPSRFGPLAGATEWPVCEVMEPPRPTHYWGFSGMGLGGMLASGVRVSFTIGIDGKPANVRVVHSIGKHSDSGAVGIVKRWRYKPATCSGVPIPFPFEVVFQ